MADQPTSFTATFFGNNHPSITMYKDNIHPHCDYLGLFTMTLPLLAVVVCIYVIECISIIINQAKGMNNGGLGCDQQGSELCGVDDAKEEAPNEFIGRTVHVCAGV